MKSLTKLALATLVVLPIATTTAFADSTGTTSTATTSTATHAQTAQARFEAAYQTRLQTEASLMQQAQQANSPNASEYSTFVSGVAAQVSNLYGSEQALATLDAAIRTNIKGSVDTTLAAQEQGLKAQLQADLAGANKNPGKTRAQKMALRKARSAAQQLGKEIRRLNAAIKLATTVHASTSVKFFDKQIASLKSTIIGLQDDEIRVTKLWIASASQSVTGSVYGSGTTTGSNGSN